MILNNSKQIKFHGNLKLSNVFLDHDNNVVAIGDLYLRHVTSKVQEDLELYKSMLNHLPPEFFTLDRDRDQYSDIWALGVILYQLSTGGFFPFISELEDDEFDEFDTKRNILNIVYDRLENRDNTQLFLDKIFTLKPGNRIKVNEILEELADKIDMSKINESMKGPKINQDDSEANDDSEENVSKHLDFLINDDESDEGIILRPSVMNGLNIRQTAGVKGDTGKVHDTDQEDFKHLDNLVQGRVNGTMKSNKTNKAKDFMDQLPDSYSGVEDSNMDNSEEESSRQVDDSEESSIDQDSMAGSNRPAPKKQKREIAKTKISDSIDTHLESAVKIITLNQDKLLIFSETQNWFVALKNKKVQEQELFESLSPSEAVLGFPPWPGQFEFTGLVVFKKNKLYLVDLPKSAKSQKLVKVTKKVNFQKVGSQSIADSEVSGSEAGERHFLVALSPSEFAVVYEQAVKLYQITDFDLVLMKEYDELINDTISYLCYYRDPRTKVLSHLAVGTESSSQVALINIKTGKVDKTLNLEEETITSVFEIADKYIAATSLNGYLAVWDKNTHIQLLKEEIMAAILVVYKIIGTSKFAIGGQGPIVIFDELDQISEVKLKNSEVGVIDFAYNESTKVLIGLTEDGTLVMHNL